MIRRGRDADIVQSGEQVYKSGRCLSELFREYSWKEILEKEIYVDPEDDPISFL